MRPPGSSPLLAPEASPHFTSEHRKNKICTKKSPQREEGKLIFLCKASVTRFFSGTQSASRRARTHTHKGNGGRSGLCGGGEWGGWGGGCPRGGETVCAYGGGRRQSGQHSSFSIAGFLFSGLQPSGDRDKGGGVRGGQTLECARKRGMCACPAHVLVKNEASGRFFFFLFFFFVEISSSKDESQFQCNYNIRSEHHMRLPPLPEYHQTRPPPLSSISLPRARWL